MLKHTATVPAHKHKQLLQNCPKGVKFTLYSIFIEPFDITGVGTKYE